MSAYGGRARNSIYRDFPFSSSNSSIVLGIVIDCKSFIIFTIFIFKDSICRVCGYILFSLQPGNFKFPVLQTVLFETSGIAAQRRTLNAWCSEIGRREQLGAAQHCASDCKPSPKLSTDALELPAFMRLVCYSS